MDDVVVFSRTFQEHYLNIVLSRMKQAGLTINQRKVQLASPRIRLLGYMVDRGTISPGGDKLGNHEVPGDVKDVQRFLGMVGYYRRFIADCAELSQPLNQLLRSNVPWHWGKNSFRALSRATANTACLYLPDLNWPFFVQTDASNHVVGTVLAQEHDAILRPVAFTSHSLNAAAAELLCHGK